MSYATLRITRGTPRPLHDAIRSDTLVAQPFYSQFHSMEAITRRQRPVIPGRDIVEAHCSGAAGTFEMSMPLGMGMSIRAKTPDPIATHDPMYEISFVQPVKHPVERHPVQLMRVAQALFDFMMRYRALLRQQHGENPNPTGGDPFTMAADHFLRSLERISH